MRAFVQENPTTPPLQEKKIKKSPQNCGFFEFWGLKSAILYAITPQMEDKFTIKAPRRVGEEEFLEYVAEKCGGSTFARRQILDFYAEMKRIDEENGKHLTPESFGRSLRDSYEVNLYTDQARYLFFSEAKQDEDVESHNRFVAACCDASEEEKEMLRRIRENEMKSIFSNPFPPIGYADLFRYQFVNFVDEIVLEKGECERKDVSGSVDTSSNILSLYEHTESNSKRTDYEIFNNTLLWRHELTHVMAIKSEYGGKYKTVNPFFITHSKGTIFKADKDFFKNENAEDRRKVASLYDEGARLMDEILTEFFTETICGDRAMYSILVNWTPDYHNATNRTHLFLKSKAPKDISRYSMYLYFGCVVEPIVQFATYKGSFVKDYHFMPTHKGLDLIKEFIKNGRLSPEMDKIVNQRVVELVKTPQSLLNEKNLNLEKFFVIIGSGYLGRKTNILNEDTMLAQAMLLDIQHNYFKDYIKKMSAGYQGTLEHKQELYKYLRKQLKYTKNVEDWVIKPNIKLGIGDKAKYARRSLSNNALAKINEENIAQKVWAEYLQTLASFTHKFAPHLLEEYGFLKKELAGKTQALQKLQQKEDQFWL